MQIPAGFLLDQFGARKVLPLSVFISACGVIIFGMTTNFYLADGGNFSFVGLFFIRSGLIVPIKLSVSRSEFRSQRSANYSLSKM